MSFWQTVRQKLTANLTLYVRADGSDSNSGLANTVAGAFLTIQKAVDTAFGNFDLNGYDISIQVGAGTYTGGVSVNRAQVGVGYITLTGDTTTPSNVVISTTSRDCVYAGGGAVLRIAGFKLTAATAGFGLHAGGIGGDGTATSVGGIAGGITIVGKMEFGAVANAYAHCYGDFGGLIQYSNASHTISGGGGAHLWVEDGGLINLDHGGTPTVTVSGTPAFAEAFAVADGGGIIRTSTTLSYSGSATGNRFRVSANGTIRFQGNSADTFFPGDSPGIFRNGGHIDGSQTNSATTLVFKNLRQDRLYRLSLFDIANSTVDDDALYMTCSANNGSTYASSGYNGHVRDVTDASVVVDTAQDAAAQFTVMRLIPRSNGATIGTLVLEFSGCNDAGNAPSFMGRSSAGRTNNEVFNSVFAGTLTTVDIDAIKFALSDGTASLNCRYKLEEIG